MYYVLDENNNRQEAYSKEEILSVIQQAIADGTLANISADAGFITKLKCACTGTTVKEAFITQAQYNALVNAGTVEPNTHYTIIDDTTCDDIDNALKTIDTDLTDLKTNVSKLNGFKQFLKHPTRVMISTGWDYATTLYKDGTATDFAITLKPDGKTLKNLVAMKGVLYLKLNSDSTYYYTVPFEGLGNSLEIGKYTFSVPSDLLSANLLMLFNALITCATYTDGDKLKFSLRSCYKIPSMEQLSIYEIRLATLDLYYN